jgi:hypothetical protein
MRGPALLARGAAGIALASCGGGKPAPEPGPKISAVPLTRVPVEEPPESDDGVQVITDKGHVEPAAVDAGIAPYREALSSCYTRRVGRRRWLGGHLSLRWEVAADGSIDRVLLADSDLGAWPVEKCVLEAARAASFGVPIGGAAEVTLPLEFSARGTPVVWDDDQSVKAVGGQLAKLDACAKGKVAMPDDVRITVYVGPRGRAQSVGFASPTTVLDDAWATCAEKAALGWRLPDPRGQVTKLAVRYRPR